MKVFLAGVALIGIGSGRAAAAVWLECDGDKIQWLSDPTIRVDDSIHALAEQGLDWVVDRWSENPTVIDVALRLGERRVSRDNGQNEVWFSTSDDVFDGSSGVSYIWYECGSDGNDEITETDVLFDADRLWTYGDSKVSIVGEFAEEIRMKAYGGAHRAFRATAMHEFGHSLGLQHHDDEYNVMGDSQRHLHANGNVVRAYPGEDAIGGLTSLYEEDLGHEDVSVTHWKWVGRNEEYSRHGRTQIFSEDNFATELETTEVDDETGFLVDNGQEIWVQFSYENNGSSTQEADVGFYLSTNNLISTWDERLSGRTLTLVQNDVYTKRHRVRLPNDLDPDTDYWIGAIVDEDDEIDEVVEWNNATYIGIHVR